MHYQDLTICDYFGDDNKSLLAVGWLRLGESFPTGDVDAHFFESLVELLVNPWQPAVAAGRQQCEFCRFTGGPARLYYKGTSVEIGTSNLFIPGDKALYVAPSMIVHYIDAHGYSPPSEFQLAVTNCPPMRSMPYLKGLRKFQVPLSKQ